METIDTQVFYWINHHHNPLADHVLWIASQGWSWAIVLVAVICAVTLRKEPRRWWVVMIGIVLCFLLSDRISVMVFKDVFCRLRPCHALDSVRMYNTSCGGLYGFVSSHAANVCALAMFFALRYRKKLQPRWVLPVLMFAWAALVCYSRPYLGKHYPGDVVCGGLLGIVVGTIVFFIMQFIENKYTSIVERKKNAQ